MSGFLIVHYVFREDLETVITRMEMFCQKTINRPTGYRKSIVPHYQA
jgi:hypothetical protein